MNRQDIPTAINSRKFSAIANSTTILRLSFFLLKYAPEYLQTYQSVVPSDQHRCMSTHFSGSTVAVRVSFSNYPSHGHFQLSTCQNHNRNICRFVYSVVFDCIYCNYNAGRGRRLIAMQHANYHFSRNSNHVDARI
jgi:hypothetical protein